MSPSFSELKGVAGNRFRLIIDPSLPMSRWREKFQAIEAPAPGQKGRVVLQGLLSGETIVTTTEENILREKTD